MDLGTGGLFDTIFRIFPWIFGAMIVIFLSVVAMIVVGIVRSRRVLREAGINPSTAQAQFAVRMMNSRSLAPTPTVEQRLTELARLRDGGVISGGEYDTRRAEIIAST